MNHRTGSFWLGLSTYWTKIVTAVGTFAVALPGLQRIDSVMISGSDDWSLHGPVLLAGFAYIASALLVLAAGLAIGDLLRLVLRWEAQLQRQEEGSARPRPEPMLSPLPTSRALLESLGIAVPQPARVPVTNYLRRNP